MPRTFSNIIVFASILLNPDMSLWLHHNNVQIEDDGLLVILYLPSKAIITELDNCKFSISFSNDMFSTSSVWCLLIDLDVNVLSTIVEFKETSIKKEH